MASVSDRVKVGGVNEISHSHAPPFSTKRSPLCAGGDKLDLVTQLLLQKRDIVPLPAGAVHPSSCSRKDRTASRATYSDDGLGLIEVGGGSKSVPHYTVLSIAYNDQDLLHAAEYIQLVRAILSAPDSQS